MQDQQEVINDSEELKSSGGNEYNDEDEDCDYNFFSTLVVTIKS